MARVRSCKQGLVLLSLISIFAIPACVYDPYYVGPPPYPHYHPHYYDYYYYPSVRVYFHFTTGFYYYYDKHRWVKTRVLPSHIRIDPHDRVQLKIPSEKPYQKNPEHVKKYSPKPDFRADKQRSFKEREANRKWYREYHQDQERRKNVDERDKKYRK